MKPAETKRLYERSCHSRRINTNTEMATEEAALWHRKFKSYDVRDVEAALDAWDQDGTLDEQKQPRGKWLPKPVELIPLIEAAQRRRVLAATERKDFVAWKCPGCGYTCSGWTNSTDPKRCARCGKEMGESHRGRAA